MYGPGMGMNAMMMNGMGMNNQQLMNMIQMYNMFNMMNNNVFNQNMMNNNAFNQNMNNINGNNQNNINNNLRGNRVINCDPFQGYNCMKYNVTFESSSGLKMNMPVPITIKVKDLFRTFVQRAGLHEGVIGKNINFIFNALYVNPFEERTIQQFGFTDYTKILVLDISNLLGGEHYEK